MAKVLITGANRGIGLELARQYAASGHNVIGCCRNAANASALTEIDGVTVCQLDPGDVDAISDLAASITGPLDILINNAGTAGPAREQQTAMSMDWDGWLDTFAVNTLAPLKVLQQFAPHLKQATPGKAITITSQLGALDLNWPTMYAYCSSKAAVNKVMRMLSAELAKENVAVGLIHPGWVRTDMGGDQADISAEESAAGIIDVIAKLDMDSTGSFMKWNGEPHAW